MKKLNGAIIVNLAGGLGNQMFQYAAGRRLANVREAELLLYHTYSPVGHRVFMLDRLRVSYRLCTGKDAGGLRQPSRSRRRITVSVR